MYTVSPSRFVTLQVLMRLNKSGYLGQLVKVCQITSRGALHSTMLTARAKCFFLSDCSDVWFDSVSFESFANAIPVLASNATEAMRLNAAFRRKIKCKMRTLKIEPLRKGCPFR